MELSKQAMEPPRSAGADFSSRHGDLPSRVLRRGKQSAVTTSGFRTRVAKVQDEHRQAERLPYNAKSKAIGKRPSSPRLLRKFSRVDGAPRSACPTTSRPLDAGLKGH